MSNNLSIFENDDLGGIAGGLRAAVGHKVGQISAGIAASRAKNAERSKKGKKGAGTKESYSDLVYALLAEAWDSSRARSGRLAQSLERMKKMGIKTSTVSQPGRAVQGAASAIKKTLNQSTEYDGPTLDEAGALELAKGYFARHKTGAVASPGRAVTSKLAAGAIKSFAQKAKKLQSSVDQPEFDLRESCLFFGQTAPNAQILNG